MRDAEARVRQVQADVLAEALCLLDTFAGEGLGHTYGNGQALMADDVCEKLARAFQIELEPGWWRSLPLAFAAEAVAEEREACAKVVNQYVGYHPCIPAITTAIRSRSKTEQRKGE